MIEGLVAQIIDTRKLALNVGSDDLVEVGMIFEVYGSSKVTITDPITHDILGNIDIAKTQVRVIDVKDKFCIAQTFKKKNVNVGGVMDLLGTSRLLSPPKIVERYETLVNDDDVKPLDPADSKVQIGDRAVQVHADSSN